jgi:hypothetical protein
MSAEKMVLVIELAINLNIPALGDLFPTIGAADPVPGKCRTGRQEQQKGQS